MVVVRVMMMIMILVVMVVMITMNKSKISVLFVYTIIEYSNNGNKIITPKEESLRQKNVRISWMYLDS